MRVKSHQIAADRSGSALIRDQLHLFGDVRRQCDGASEKFESPGLFGNFEKVKSTPIGICADKQVNIPRI
jgi:hypothetical protein